MLQASFHPAIPVHIVTGALGSGKTTAIAHLLANKPVDENWLVILNEFTDTGIDALTLAAAARGVYDVRMIPGGCLCCTGEADFRRQLGNLLQQPRRQWPARILIEPSGIAHPGAIVEELRGYQRSGALHLLSTIALIEAQSWQGEQKLTSLVREQVDAADVVLLSKAELASESVQEQFTRWAEQLFPAKRFIGESRAGVLPQSALTPPAARFAFMAAVPHTDVHQHVPAPQVSDYALSWHDQPVSAQLHRLLQREACGWKIPGTLLFDLARLQALLHDPARWQGVERFKAVVRTGVDSWYLLQRWGIQHSIAACAWRQDSRIELQLVENVSGDWPAWHACWQDISERCPVS
jgi:G3E family GTPase